MIINTNKELSEKQIKLIENESNLFEMYVSLCFYFEWGEKIEKLKKLNLSDDKYEYEENILFDKYVSENNSRFINEFNYRMDKFNIEIVHIKI